MNTDFTAIDAALDKHWTPQLQLAAAREGWLISKAEELAKCGPLQVQKIDDPAAWARNRSFIPPTLDSDDVACMMVRTGTGPHHLIARQLVAAFNEPEFSRWCTLPGVADHWSTPGLGEVVGVSANLKPAPPVMVIGGRYNWRGQHERLVYVGFNWSGNGRWHQFELVDKPGKVWCEVQPDDLAMFEETKPEPTPVGAGDGNTFIVSETAVVKRSYTPLPYSFDLLYDIKSVEELHDHLTGKRRTATSATDQQLLNLMQEYNIPAPCPDSDNMGIHACGNAAQCWEPCGQLGHDEKHVVPGKGEMLDFGPECVITLDDGTELRTPAHPAECDFVRFVKDGEEEAYWTVEEWRDDPADVMGAIIGCIKSHSGGPVESDTDLRQTLGEALTTKLADMCKDGVPDWFDAAHIDEVLDAVMPHIEVLPDTTCETEAQSYALEAIWQFLPELPSRNDDNTVLTPAQLERLLRQLGWKPPCEQRAAPVQPADPIRELLAEHRKLVDETSEYTYFELAYTRPTGFMAWLTDKPLAHTVVNPDRKVIVSGQGSTAEEACQDALRQLQEGQR